MTNYIERDGKIFWRKPVAKVGGCPVADRLVPEEKIARYLMLELRRGGGTNSQTCRALRSETRQVYHIHFTDKDMRGILRRLQIQGKPVVSTPHGFALATKAQVAQQAARMMKHGFAEVMYARRLLGSRLWYRLVGQLRLNLKARG